MASVSASFNKVPMTQKILLGLLLLVAVAAVWYFVFYSPKSSELAGKADEKAAAERDLAQALVDYKTWEKLTHDLEVARGELQQLNLILPVTRDVEGLMTRINAQAKDARLRLTNIVPEEEKEDESGMYIRIPIKIEFRGNYHQILQFFHLIDSGIQRLVNMENIKLEREATPEEPNLLKGSVLATTFMAKEPNSGEATAGQTTGK